LDFDAAFDWSPDDHRLEALADRAQRWMQSRPNMHIRRRPLEDPAIVQLIATAAGPSSPAWDRLAEIARQRMASR
jgi:hypothetical protein